MTEPNDSTEPAELADTAETPEYRRIRSVAVHREDVATALEATLRSDQTVVLRVTPPFSGRMRARLHSLGVTEPEQSTPDRNVVRSRPTDGAASTEPTEPAPIHIQPTDLVGTVPSYPEADDTATQYPDSDITTRRERHADAVDAWREQVRSNVVESVALESPTGNTHRVAVAVLG